MGILTGQPMTRDNREGLVYVIGRAAALAADLEARAAELRELTYPPSQDRIMREHQAALAAGRWAPPAG